MRCGFCYVATTEGYLAEVMQSIATLKAQIPDALVAVATHRHLFRQDGSVSDWIEIQKTREGPIVKTDARLAPYDRIVFLDADTHIIGDITDIFTVLDSFDLAVAHEVNTMRSWEADQEAPIALQECNTGVIAFKKSDNIDAFFSCWLEEYDRFLAAHDVKNDQVSFRAALWKCHSIRHAILGREYNFVACAPMVVERSVKIVHSRSRRLGPLIRSLNPRLGVRAVVPGLGTIFHYRGRRHWILQYLRLTANFLRVLVNPRSVGERATPVIWWSDVD